MSFLAHGYLKRLFAAVRSNFRGVEGKEMQKVNKLRPAYDLPENFCAKRDLTEWAEATMREACHLDSLMPNGAFATWLSRETYSERN